jgi:hypothetical protein
MTSANTREQTSVGTDSLLSQLKAQSGITLPGFESSSISVH